MLLLLFLALHNTSNIDELVNKNVVLSIRPSPSSQKVTMSDHKTELRFVNLKDGKIDKANNTAILHKSKDNKYAISINNRFIKYQPHDKSLVLWGKDKDNKKYWFTIEKQPNGLFRFKINDLCMATTTSKHSDVFYAKMKKCSDNKVVKDIEVKEYVGDKDKKVDPLSQEKDKKPDPLSQEKDKKVDLLSQEKDKKPDPLSQEKDKKPDNKQPTSIYSGKDLSSDKQDDGLRASDSPDKALITPIKDIEAKKSDDEGEKHNLYVIDSDSGKPQNVVRKEGAEKLQEIPEKSSDESVIPVKTINIAMDENTNPAFAPFKGNKNASKQLHKILEKDASAFFKTDVAEQIKNIDGNDDLKALELQNDERWSKLEKKVKDIKNYVKRMKLKNIKRKKPKRLQEKRHIIDPSDLKPKKEEIKNEPILIIPAENLTSVGKDGVKSTPQSLTDPKIKSTPQDSTDPKTKTDEMNKPVKDKEQAVYDGKKQDMPTQKDEKSPTKIDDASKNVQPKTMESAPAVSTPQEKIQPPSPSQKVQPEVPESVQEPQNVISTEPKIDKSESSKNNLDPQKDVSDRANIPREKRPARKKRHRKSISNRGKGLKRRPRSIDAEDDDEITGETDHTDEYSDLDLPESEIDTEPKTKHKRRRKRKKRPIITEVDISPSTETKEPDEPIFPTKHAHPKSLPQEYEYFELQTPSDANLPKPRNECEELKENCERIKRNNKRRINPYYGTIKPFQSSNKPYKSFYRNQLNGSDWNGDYLNDNTSSIY